GLSAALMVAEMAAWAKAEGTTLIGRLDELAAEHGLYSTSQLSIRVEDLSRIGAMMERLRQAPPTTLLSSTVVEDQDLSRGSVATTGLPPTEGILLRSEDDTRWWCALPAPSRSSSATSRSSRSSPTARPARRSDRSAAAPMRAWSR